MMSLNVVYFVWVSNSNRSKLLNKTITNQTLQVTCKELGVSILSLRKYSPDTKVTVYIAKDDKDILSFMIPFLEEQKCQVRFLDERDHNDSLFIKFMFFRKALDDFKRFIYLDIDALVVSDINQLPEPETVDFVPYEKFQNNRHPMSKKQYKFMKKHFRIKRPFNYVNTYLINVNQCKSNNAFWTKFRNSMDNITKTFMAKCNGVKTDELNINDELYFTLAIFKSKAKIQMVPFNKLVKIIRHGKKFRRSPNKPKYEEQVPF